MSKCLFISPASIARQWVLLALLFCAGPQAADPAAGQAADELGAFDRAVPDADRRLESIKQALIDLSLGADLKLASSAYIDELGVLHESSIVTSHSQVRGVRVLSYLEEAGMSSASLEASMAASECPMARPGLRREALVSVSYGDSNPRLGDHYLSEVAILSQRYISAALTSSETWTATPRQHFASGYHRAMSASGNSRPPWEIQIALRETRQEFTRSIKGAQDYLSQRSADALSWTSSKIAPLADRQPWPAQLLGYELRLVDPQLGKVMLTQRGQIEYPRLPRGYDKSQLPPNFISQWAVIAREFVAQLDTTLQCAPHYYHVRSGGYHARSGSEPMRSSGNMSDVHGESGQIRINAGTRAGVQPGDQFLLSRTPQITGQGASLDDIDKLVLAEVQEVSPYSATLVAIAGGQGGDIGAISRATNNFSHYVAIHF